MSSTADDDDEDDDGRRCVEHLMNDLDSLHARYCQEYEITIAEFVGCLETFKFHVLLGSMTSDDEFDEEE